MKSQDVYNLWKNSVTNEEHLEQLNTYTEQEIESLFTSELEFGTGGIRAVMGQAPSLLNEYTIRKITQGLANYLNSKYDNPSVVIAHDCRNNSRLFANVSSVVLMENKIKVYQFSELVPTPILSYAVRELSCDAGIMITASHNPKEYNGYKVYDNSGAQLNLADAGDVIAEISKVDVSFKGVDLDKVSEQTIIDESLLTKYIEDHKTNNENKKLKIVFTPNHGTAYKLGPQILNASGYNDVICVSEQMQPDGNFSNTKSANPEEITSFELANKYLVENNYDVALATDPDADRIGIVVNENGELTAYSGNLTGTLLIKYLIDTNQYDDKSIIYKTIVTGEMGAILGRNKSIKVEETLTGFKFIGEKIRLNKEDKLLIGYEESYGYLFKDDVRDKDAISSMVMISDMLNYYKLKGMTVQQILQQVYEEVGYYHEQTFSYTVSDLKINEKVMSMYRSYNETQIFGHEIESKIDYMYDDTGLPKADVIKFYLKDVGWIVFRPSGTEPKIKLYASIKAGSLQTAKTKALLIEEQFSKILNEL